MFLDIYLGSVANRKGSFELGGLMVDSAIVNLLLDLLCSELLCTLPILWGLQNLQYYITIGDALLTSSVFQYQLGLIITMGTLSLTRQTHEF